MADPQAQGAIIALKPDESGVEPQKMDLRVQVRWKDQEK